MMGWRETDIACRERDGRGVREWEKERERTI